MAIHVVGTVAFDSVRTPHGERRDILGGSAAHFSVSASFFAPVRLTAVVGEDFEEAHRRPLLSRGVDLSGLRAVPGRTFRWSGEYGDDPNDARTLETQLNVIATHAPEPPPAWGQTPVVFLANLDPEIQERILEGAGAARLAAADTMNYWIASKPESVRRVLSRVGIAFLNDAEARQLTGRSNVLDAADSIRDLGPEVVVVKRGEHGVLVAREGEIFSLPALPLRKVVDPTGAGDTFAGGFLGHVASRLGEGDPDWRRAAVVGSVMASFQVEDFSCDRLLRLRPEEIGERYRAFSELTRFGPLVA